MRLTFTGLVLWTFTLKALFPDVGTTVTVLPFSVFSTLAPSAGAAYSLVSTVFDFFSAMFTVGCAGGAVGFSAGLNPKSLDNTFIYS